jgi:hypothetical protein
MPNEVGKILQAAQDDIQRVSGNPAYITFSKDATGAGRHQVLDSNWQVCSQDVAPGTKVTGSTIITFAAVKVSKAAPEPAGHLALFTDIQGASFIAYAGRLRKSTPFHSAPAGLEAWTGARCARSW